MPKTKHLIGSRASQARRFLGEKPTKKPNAIVIEGDATVIMPIMTSALLDRLGKRK